MSGRLEKDLNIENKIKNIIVKQPKIIDAYAKSFNNKTANTKKTYIEKTINFCLYLQKEFEIDFNDTNSVKNLNYSHIISYIDFIKNHSPNGDYNYKEEGSSAVDVFAIKHFCKYLKLCRYIDYNPCDEIEIPKDKKEHKVVFLTPEEITKIKNNIYNGVGSDRAKLKQKAWRNRDLCIVFLAITTGLRVSAITNIDISDINFEEKFIVTIEKGGIERRVYLSDKMINIIKEWMNDRVNLLSGKKCDALFISAERNRIGVNTIRDMLKKYTYNINKKITPHKLRSTTATNVYEESGDIYLTAEMLGHKNIQNTRRYAQVSIEKRIQAVNQLSDLI